jgi:hypothetical protein
MEVLTDLLVEIGQGRMSIGNGVVMYLIVVTVLGPLFLWSFILFNVGPQVHAFLLRLVFRRDVVVEFPFASFWYGVLF